MMLLIPSGLCLLGGLVSWRRNRLGTAALLALVGFAFAGASAARLFVFRFPPNDISNLTDQSIDLSEPVRIEGELITTPLRTPYGLQFDVNARRIESHNSSDTVTGKIRLYVMNGRKVAAASLHLSFGDSIITRARLERPRNYANPGSFDYRQWLQMIQDIYWQGTVEDTGWVQRMRGPAPTGFYAAALELLSERVRQPLLRSIDRLYPPWTISGKDGAVLKAVLLGDRSSLDSDTIEDFRKTGLYHLLVVAGLHVGLLAMLAEGLLRLIRIRPTWRAALLLVLLVFYASLVEQRAPTLRASLMIGAYLLARLLDREQPVLNAVGLAALVLLFERPGWLFDAGFQLSFAAALLIAGLALPVLERTTEPYRRALWHLEEPVLEREFAPHLAQFRLDVRDVGEWLGRRVSYLQSRPLVAIQIVAAPLKAAIWAVNLFIFSAVLQLGLLLPMAVTFHRVALAGIGLNVLAIPCMTILLGVAVPTVILNTLFPALAVLPGKLLAAILNVLFSLTEFTQLPPWLSYRVPTPPAWVAWGFAFCLVLAACALTFSKRVFAIAILGAAAFGALISIQPFSPRIPAGVFEITDLDCGGGEALFVVLPDRVTMLMGACGSSHRQAGGGDPLRAPRWDPGENIVSPYLWSRGIKTIDVFLLPDARGGHLSGVASVVRSFHVKEFWCGALPPEPYFTALLDLLHRRGVRFQQLLPGEALTRSATSMSVVWPPAPSASDVPAVGTPSMIQISNAEGSLLLAGELEQGDLENVTGSRLALHSQVLQASGREGLSPEFAALAAKVHARVILLGAGTRGEGDLGGSSRLNLFKGLGTEFFGNSIEGAVTVNMQGTKLSVQRYRRQR